MRRSFGFVLLFMLSFALVTASQERGAFTQLDLGGKASGMGGAFTAVADDATAVGWNSAGLGNLQAGSVSVMNTDLYGLGIAHSYLTVTVPNRKFGTVGLSWERVNCSPALGYGYLEDKLTLAVGKKVSFLPWDSNLGVSLNYYSTELDSAALDNARSGLGVSIAFLGKVKDWLAVGISAGDLASSIKSDETSEKENLPVMLSLGVSVRCLNRLLLAADVHDLVHSPQISAGAEYSLSHDLAVRVGLKPETITAGIGVKRGTLNFDYSYNRGDLGASQRISVGVSF
jgi:hypothetical protein